MKSLALFIWVLFLNISALFAHQGYGIVADSDGNIYFTDISRTTIWKVDADGQLNAIAKNKWSHQIWIDSAGRLYFTNEEQINGNSGYSFWRYDESGQMDWIIPPRPRKAFPSDIFTMDASGRIFVADNYQIYAADGKFAFHPMTFKLKDSPDVNAEFEGIRSITTAADGDFYIADIDKIKRIRNGTVETIAENLLESDPQNLPVKNAPNPSVINRLFGLCVDSAGNVFVAYFGNRQVLRISPEGETTVFYESQAPWSPVGVISVEGGLYIKQHGFIENEGWIGPQIIKQSAGAEPSVIADLSHAP